MFDLSTSEKLAIDGALEEKLAWANDNHALCEQMALDASRLLSCTEDRLSTYQGQGFFKRCWFSLSGKTSAIERANQKDLVEMQKFGWRYINLLQERDLLEAHSIISIKNNLTTLAIEQDNIRSEVTKLADRVYDRFIILENRVENIETSQRIYGWLLTIDSSNYDKIFSENFRLLRVLKDFYSLKSNSWNIIELRCLHKGLREVGIDINRKIGVSNFIDGVVDEIEEQGYESFIDLITHESGPLLDDNFIADSISAPSFSSLYEIKKNYTSSSRIIRSLQNNLSISHSDAVKIVLREFIDEQGIDRNIEIPVKDLAIEILSCFSLSHRLASQNQMPPHNENKIIDNTILSEITRAVSSTFNTGKESAESFFGRFRKK